MDKQDYQKAVELYEFAATMGLRIHVMDSGEVRVLDERSHTYIGAHMYSIDEAESFVHGYQHGIAEGVLRRKEKSNG